MLKAVDNDDIVLGLATRLESLRTLAPDPSGLPPLPAMDELRHVLQVAFWASLQEEEGRSLSGSLVFRPPGYPRDLTFGKPQPFTVPDLVKLAPAVHDEKRGIGVYRSSQSHLEIWGTGAQSPVAFIVAILGPGFLVARYHLRNVLVYRAGEAVFLGEEDYTTLLRIIALGLKGDPAVEDRINTAAPIMGIVHEIYRQGHGGTLLVVPAESTKWQSALASLQYPCSPPYGAIREARTEMQRAGVLPYQMPYGAISHELEDTLKTAVEEVGRLTAVDGALLIDSRLDVLGFGGFIKSTSASTLGEISVLEAGRVNEGGKLMQLDALGGTRHRSAAEFCAQVTEAFAVVASQDRSLTIMGWASEERQLIGLRHAERYLV